MKASFFALLAVTVATSIALEAAPGKRTGQYDVYVLAGQSNMSGRGALAELTAAEGVADPRIRLYGNDGRWHAALDPLDDASGQIDDVSADRQAAVGPGLFFARAMLRSGPMRRGRSRTIALVPCAKGGSAIGRWTPTGADRATLYGSCLARIRAAGGRVAGILWYQGESDANTPVDTARDTAPGWTNAFAALVATWRRDLAAPTLPVVVVQLADKPRVNAERFAGWASIQRQQDQLTVACARVVTARGLSRNADDLHLTTDAQRTLGPRLAEAMLALQTQGCR